MPAILTISIAAISRGKPAACSSDAFIFRTAFGPLVFPWLVTTWLGWRMLYLAAGAMIPILAVYWTKIRETRRFAEQTRTATRISLLRDFKATLSVFQRRYSREIVAGTSIWFLTNFWTTARSKTRWISF